MHIYTKTHIKKLTVKNYFNHNNRILTCDVCKLNYGLHLEVFPCTFCNKWKIC